MPKNYKRICTQAGLSAVLLGLCVASASAQLRQQIEAIAARAHGHVGVACSLPGVPLDCNLYAEEHLPMQSVYKFPIAMAVLHSIDQGHLSLTQKVRFLPSDFISPEQHSPLQKMHPQGNADVSIEELLQLMLKESDGAASDVLLRVLGGPETVNRYVHSLGMCGIQIQDTEQTLGKDSTAQYRNYAEPQALVQLLRLLADKSPLSAQNTRLLMRWMTETDTGQHRIKGLLPPNTVVTHKTGSSGQDKTGNAAATNDVGLITLVDGHKLALAVLISDSKESESTREAVIAEIAKAIWKKAAQTDAARP